MFKNFEEAAYAVDEMFNSVLQNAVGKHSPRHAPYDPCLPSDQGSDVDGEDSGEESGDDGEGGERRDVEEEDEEDAGAMESPVSHASALISEIADIN